MATSSPTRGMVLGKFMPPHLGHLYLLDFALNYVDELTIVVETQRGQPVPGELRYRWVCEMYPRANVVHLTDENPQDPSEHPDFWNIWKASLTRILPHRPDFVFASEDYGWKLSEVLGATFVPVDIARGSVPVSGTAIRNEPLKHWTFIPRVVRPYFVKRVCVFGPESTGKSTLTTDLARRFATVAVPEYARTHLEAQGGIISAADIPKIARGQMATEDALALNADRVLFCDTDLLLTSIWSRWLYGSCPEWIESEAECRRYDLYLVTDVDVPWVGDSVRYLPEERRSFLERCVGELERLGRRYVMVSGDWETRLRAATKAVEELLKESGAS